MTQSPLVLAALAVAAVPGVIPVEVQALRGVPDGEFELAVVGDDQQRRWVVRRPVHEVAAARMEVALPLLALLHRRVPFAVPQPKGFAEVKGVGRAAVYPYLPGRPVSFGSLAPGAGLAAEIGRAIAALHNVDRRLYEEAGVPSYESDAYRERRLADVDRAAATGHVPAALLARWESRLEDVSVWRFAPVPTHGAFRGEHVLASFEDEEDAATGRVRALLGWEDAKVADPADDFAELLAQCSAEAFDSVLEAYAHARAERLDAHLEDRAQLAAELRLVSRLLTAVAAEDDEHVAHCASALRDLDERLAHEEAEHERAVAERPLRRTPPPAAVGLGAAAASVTHQGSGAGPGSGSADVETVAWTDADEESVFGDGASDVLDVDSGRPEGDEADSDEHHPDDDRDDADEQDDEDAPDDGARRAASSGA